MSYSSAKAKPPWVCTQALAASQGASAPRLFAMFGFGPTIEPGLVFAGGFLHHQLGGAHRRIGLCNGKLDALVLADRPAEHRALPGVIRCLGDEPFGGADAFGGDQNELRVHA